MNSNITLKLDYQKDEAVSAQQMQMLESNRFKVMIAIGILCFLGLVVQQIWFWFESKAIPVAWWGPILFLLAAGVGLGQAYLRNPLSSFKSNPSWHNRLDLRLSTEQVHISSEGQSEGFEMAWERIKRVLENGKVYVLFWGSEQEFIVLPKRVLQTQDEFFRDQLKRIPNLVWKVWKQPKSG